MPTLDAFYDQALALLGLTAGSLTEAQEQEADELEADLRAEWGWARLDWLDANPGPIGL